MVVSFILSVVWQIWSLKTKEGEVGTSQSYMSKEVSSSLVPQITNSEVTRPDPPEANHITAEDLVQVAKYLLTSLSNQGGL